MDFDTDFSIGEIQLYCIAQCYYIDIIDAIDQSFH